MTIDTTALREIAEAATPGPWEAEGSQVLCESWFLVAAVRDHSEIEYRADAAHIAAFHPGTALALLAEVDALRAQVERVREALFASDDGTEHEHDRDHGQAEGSPDCPGCWVETIRRALDGEVPA